jgi:hypothetical protein
MDQHRTMLVAISAAHGRHAITRAWAEHTASLGFDGVCVSVSIGDEANMSMFSGMPYAGTLMRCELMDNDPLAGKFNAALHSAMELGATRIMILPSDDFVSPAWVEAARTHEGDYCYPHECGIVDAASQQAYVIRKLSFGQLKYGAGRVVSRKVVDALGGKLWPELLNGGLDSASHAAITKARFPITIVKTEGIPITDVKTADNLWPFRTWQGSGQECTADEALHMVSPSVRAQLDALRQ